MAYVSYVRKETPPPPPLLRGVNTSDPITPPSTTPSVSAPAIPEQSPKAAQYPKLSDPSEPPTTSTPSILAATARPRRLTLSIDQFIHRWWANTISPREYLGAEVTWDMEVTERDPEAGPGTINVYDDKFHVAFPPSDKALDARLNRLQYGDVIRVTGILQERPVPAFNKLHGTLMLVASDFQLLRRSNQ